MDTKNTYGGKRAGAGRKRRDPQIKRQTIALCLPPLLIERLTSEAKKRGISRSELAEIFLKKNCKLT